MHLRPKPWARPELEASPLFISEPWSRRGQWRKLFPNPSRPLYAELGCGKGSFIAAESAAYPENNYIAIDMIDTVLGYTRRKIVKRNQKPENVRITAWDISRFEVIFSETDALDGLYINFCNPWPKHRQHKKRLTHPRLLAQYQKVLKPGAFIRFKTDDAELFEDSLKYFSASGFIQNRLTRDLHNSDIDGGAQTEHEKKFAEQGIPIKFVEVIWTSDESP